MNRSIHSYWPVSVYIFYELSITDIFLGTPYMDANLQQQLLQRAESISDVEGFAPLRGSGRNNTHGKRSVDLESAAVKFRLLRLSFLTLYLCPLSINVFFCVNARRFSLNMEHRFHPTMYKVSVGIKPLPIRHFF
jgi:hypothetical protein